MNSHYQAPILIIAFNRHDTTQKIFDVIRVTKPSKLYIAVDAPRAGNVEDQKNVAQVKQIFDKINWECEVHKRYSEINQGCGPGPYNAISWVFEQEDRAIILEDDCIPAIAFFSYCNELLEKYKDDKRIWLISGNQYNEEAVTTPHSYFFSRYGHSHGWATWKRCWLEMDVNMTKYPLIKNQNLLKSAFRTKKEYLFFRNKFDRIFNDTELKTHIWDFQFMLALKSNDALTIVPRKNLITNVGYIGTHSYKKAHYHDRKADENFVIISHPEFIICDVDYDSYHFENHWYLNRKLFMRIINKLKKVLKLV